MTATHRVFWSSAGFAFERAGRHELRVAVRWSASGVPVSARGGADVFVEHPTTEADNEAAALVMHPQVGMWVALGGGADHLAEAVSRIAALTRPQAGARATADGSDVVSSRIAASFAAIADGSGGGDRPAGAARRAPSPRKRR